MNINVLNSDRITQCDRENPVDSYSETDRWKLQILNVELIDFYFIVL